jgi:acetyltransferase EpsM
LKRILILGAGGHGKEVYSYILDLAARGDAIAVAGLMDDAKAPGPWEDTEVLGPIERLASHLAGHDGHEFGFITAVGSNAVRRELVKRMEALETPGVSAWTLVHPHACVGRGVTIGEGTCLAPGVIVTTRVRIGSHCILNVHSSVSHDCVVGDYVNINPAATVCGNVQIGDGAFIGAGSTVKEKISIGEGAVIGAGAVVVRNIPPHVTAVGVPARVVERREGAR